MLTISRDKVIDILKGGVEPAAYCDSGDKVIFATRDCYDDDLITEETPNGVKEGGMANPATGPLYVSAGPRDLAAGGRGHAHVAHGGGVPPSL